MVPRAEVYVIPAERPRFLGPDAGHYQENQVGTDGRVGLGCPDELDRHVARHRLGRPAAGLALWTLGQC